MTLNALLFGLALGFIWRRVRREDAIGPNAAMVPGLGGEGSPSTQDDQDGSEREQDHCHFGLGSHLLRPAKQETHEAKPGHGDADSNKSFGRYRRPSARFLRAVHGKKIGEAKSFSELAN